MPFLLPTAALTSCQNSQPFHEATRRLSSARSVTGTRFVSCWRAAHIAFAARKRSEEHTSELQSRLHLVCRLLLEKKKNKYNPFAKIQETLTASSDTRGRL